MRAIFALIIVSAAAVAAGWWIEHLVGALTLQLGGTTVQAPLSVAVLALILLVVAVYVLTRLLATIFGLPGAFRRGGITRTRRRGDQAVTKTLIALAARDPADARKEAARARRLLGDTPQTLLLSAYAGNMSGDTGEAEAAFDKLAQRKDSAFLGLRGLLRLAIERDDFVRAAELARQAEAAHPGAAWLRGERTQLALRTGAWAEALQLTQEDAPKAGFGAAAAEAETDPAIAHKLAKAAFKRDPALSAAAIAYARRLRDGNREKAAQDVLRKSWGIAPNPELADFALLPAPDKRARLQSGFDLVKAAPDHPESQLLLARLSLEAGLVDDAHKHVQRARDGGLDQRRLHLLLADICEAEGDDAAQRDALRSAAMAAPDPGWRCENCGSTLGGWAPACPVCTSVGRVKWGQGVFPSMRPASLILPHASSNGPLN
jgi:HemY protein